MASVWGELKRRNVVRVAIAYIVVGWLLLQSADVLVPLLALPEWVGRLIFLLLLIGFPLALFFAWAYELTPAGLKKETDVNRAESITHITGRKLDFIVIGVLAIALMIFALDKFFWTQSEAPTTANNSERRTIAVLPFVNMSSDPEQEYFKEYELPPGTWREENGSKFCDGYMTPFENEVYCSAKVPESWVPFQLNGETYYMQPLAGSDNQN